MTDKQALLEEALEKAREKAVDELFLLKDLVGKDQWDQLSRRERLRLESDFLLYAIKSGIDIIPRGKTILEYTKFKKMS